MQKWPLYFLFIFFISLNAKAGFLIEPIVGYNVTAVEFKTATATYGTAASGMVLGARAGLTIFDTFFIAADYSSGDLDWEPENGSSIKISGKLTRKGLSAGMDVPIAPLRVWLGYYESEFDPSGGGQNYVFEDGKGVKAGLGLTFLPIIDINIEYYKGDYDDYKLNNVKQNYTAEDTGLMLSLSAPFSL